MDWSNRYFRRWFWMAPLGLALVGFGLCLLVEAGYYKHSGADTWDWFLYGTLALVVFNSGLSIFGGAVVNRARYERQKSTIDV